MRATDMDIHSGYAPESGVVRDGQPPTGTNESTESPEWPDSAKVPPRQCAARELPDELWDAVIVGAGPAGSFAAARLASAGHRVLLLDKKTFPREKVCGEGLTPQALQRLDDIGLGNQVRNRGHIVQCVSWFSPSRTEVEIRSDFEFVTLKRPVLDALIARRAVESGAVMAHADVNLIRFEPHGAGKISVKETTRPIRGRIVLLATGADMELVRRSGFTGQLHAASVAVRAYVTSSAVLDRLVFAFEPYTLPGYAWIFPMGHGEYNVGCGILTNRPKQHVNLRHMFHRFLDEFPAARELMRQNGRCTPLQGARIRMRLDAPMPTARQGNLLTIGEAAGTTLPFSGEGISRAMESAELASGIVSEALRTGRYDLLHSYPDTLQRVMAPQHRDYEAAERWLSKEWLNDLLARRIRHNDFLKRVLAGVAYGTAELRQVASIKGLFRSLSRPD